MNGSAPCPVCERPKVCECAGSLDWWFIELADGRTMEKEALDFAVSGAFRSREVVSAINISSLRVKRSA